MLVFSGIVEEIGTVRHAGATAAGVRLEIASSRVVEDLAIDSSVNVAGACLTVVERDDHGFAVDVVKETLERTTLGRALRGTRVNLERAATPTTALGGHFVQGHVDATSNLVAAAMILALRGKAVGVTSAAFVGSHDVTLTLTQGRWFFYWGAGKKTTFFVAS